jgi:hypothetical protein
MFEEAKGHLSPPPTTRSHSAHTHTHTHTHTHAAVLSTYTRHAPEAFLPHLEALAARTTELWDGGMIRAGERNALYDGILGAVRVGTPQLQVCVGRVCVVGEGGEARRVCEDTWGRAERTLKLHGSVSGQGMGWGACQKCGGDSGGRSCFLGGMLLSMLVPSTLCAPTKPPQPHIPRHHCRPLSLTGCCRLCARSGVQLSGRHVSLHPKRS